MNPTLPARAVLAVMAIGAAAVVPPLRPAAVTLLGLALLDGVPSEAPVALRAARHVLWPGVALAGALWGLGRPAGARTALVLFGLGAALCGALYVPGVGVPAALAARIVALAGLVLLLSERMPRSWAEKTAVIPVFGLAIGLVFGVWPLIQQSAAAVIANWRLARIETAASMTAEACAILLAWRRDRRTMSP